MNRLKEPLSNIVLVCDQHAPKPDPRYRTMPLHALVGKYCKLAFHDQGRIEHMWVRCTALGHMTDFQLKGTLDNDPVVITSVEYGDQVLFNRSEIEDLCEVGACR
jgi:uncharacterized protein YegJ (DUF2314 family)